MSAVQIQWQDPPANGLTQSPQQRKRSALQTFLEAVRTQPGRWAVYPDSHSKPGTIAVERAAVKTGYEGFEFKFIYDEVTPEVEESIRTRSRSWGGGNTPASRGTTYVRYVGVHGAEDGLD